MPAILEIRYYSKEEKSKRYLIRDTDKGMAQTTYLSADGTYHYLFAQSTEEGATLAATTQPLDKVAMAANLPLVKEEHLIVHFILPSNSGVDITDKKVEPNGAIPVARIKFAHTGPQ